MSFFRDPLLHFLAAGLLLFVAYDYFDVDTGGTQDADPRRIIVDEATLLRFIAYRSKNFDEGIARQRLERAPPAQVKDLIQQYVEEEAHYRRAKQLGLDQDDYVIRRRLVQKVTYMAEGVGVDAYDAVSRSDLQTYYAKHSQRYEQPGRLIFTHVFFGTRDRSMAHATELAQATLVRLNEQKVAFSDAARFGERFLYQLNYVERPHDEVAAHFGKSAADELFSLVADNKRWVGPIASEHGVHLVLLKESQAAYLPELDEAVEEVRADFLAEQAASRRAAYTQELLENFDIEIAQTLKLAAATDDSSR